MLLVDEGKVELDAPVVRYLPRFRMLSPGYESITVRMLLTHQSGVPGSYFNWGFTTAPVMDMNRRILDWLGGQYAQYEPGFVSAYTNNGFQLAEEIVAAVSGRTYYQFVRDRILEPLGMTRTGLDAMDPALQAGLSKPYSRGEEQTPEYVNLIGTGGFTSTPGDLCRFLAMINRGGTAFGRTVLKAASVAEMGRNQSLRARVQIPDTIMAPGLGWDHYADPALAYAAEAPMKDGSTYRFASQVITMPAYNLAVAVVANDLNASTAAMARQILMAALEERYGISKPEPLAGSKLTPAGFDLNTLAGQYGSASFGGIAEIRTDGSVLEIWVRRGDELRRVYGPLTHREGGWFENDTYPGMQFTVRNLGGRDTLLIRYRMRHYWGGFALGERLGPAPTLSPAWKARLGKTWVAADMGLADLDLAEPTPAIQLTEREGRLVYEALAAPAAGRRRSLDPLARQVAAAFSARATETYALEPVDDRHAWVPLQINCRDLTHLQVIEKDGQEWLRVGYVPTLWRPLESIPEPEAARPHTASIQPDIAAWVRLPAAADEYVLTAPESVHWVLYDENLQPFFEAWGGGWRLARPAGSSTGALYLALYSLTPQRATVQRLQGRTFSSATGAMRLAR